MNSVNWGGNSLIVYDPRNTTWNDVGGVYVFASINQNGNWQAHYIGQTNSFATRMPDHERWEEAARAGATHIHAMVAPLAGHPGPNRTAIDCDLSALVKQSSLG